MFLDWFDVEITDAVFDLTPDEPLTQHDVDIEDLHYAIQHCAWCDVEIDEGAGRFADFSLTDRALFAHRDGRVLRSDPQHQRPFPLSISRFGGLVIGD